MNGTVLHSRTLRQTRPSSASCRSRVGCLCQASGQAFAAWVHPPTCPQLKHRSFLHPSTCVRLPRASSAATSPSYVATANSLVVEQKQRDNSLSGTTHNDAADALEHLLRSDAALNGAECNIAFAGTMAVWHCAVLISCFLLGGLSVLALLHRYTNGAAVMQAWLPCRNVPPCPVQLVHVLSLVVALHGNLDMPRSRQRFTPLALACALQAFMTKSHGLAFGGSTGPCVAAESNCSARCPRSCWFSPCRCARDW